MKKILIPFLFASSMFASNEVNLEITNYTIAVDVKQEVVNENHFAFRGSYLYNDKKNTNNYFSVGFQAQGESMMSNDGTQMALFVDFAHTENNSALPIGMTIFNDDIGNLNNPIFMKFEVAYAPAVLSFDDAQRFFKAKTEIGIKPIENAKVSVGYKKISFNKSYQSIFYVGVGFVF